MPSLYIQPEELKGFAEQPESDDENVWQQLCESVSRSFDRECEVPDGFFDKAASAASARVFLGAGTEYLKLLPYIAGSITAITVDAVAVTLSSDNYSEAESYLVFKYLITKNAAVSVSARWGFADIPAEVKQACIEQAIYQWRRKDLAFAEISGVASAAVVNPFSPTFKATTDRYRGIYSQNTYFA